MAAVARALHHVLDLRRRNHVGFDWWVAPVDLVSLRDGEESGYRDCTELK